MTDVHVLLHVKPELAISFRQLHIEITQSHTCRPINAGEVALDVLNLSVSLSLAPLLGRPFPLGFASSKPAIS